MVFLTIYYNYYSKGVEISIKLDNGDIKVGDLIDAITDQCNIDKNWIRIIDASKKKSVCDDYNINIKNCKIILCSHTPTVHSIIKTYFVSRGECIICYNKISSVGIYPCFHDEFCNECIDNLKICPLCRGQIKSKYIF